MMPSELLKAINHARILQSRMPIKPKQVVAPKPKPDETPRERLIRLSRRYYASQNIEIDLPPPPPPEFPPLSMIVDIVMKFFGLKKNQFVARRHNRAIVRPRQIAWYIATEKSGQSFPVIGRVIGNFDHTTVIHGANLIARLILEDDQLRYQVGHLMAEVEQRFRDKYQGGVA